MLEVRRTDPGTRNGAGAAEDRGGVDRTLLSITPTTMMALTKISPLS
jgi:hypothetical protein